MRKPIIFALALMLSGVAVNSVAAQSDSLTADPATPLFDPSNGSFSIQNLMEATRNQSNRANRRTIGTNVDAEIERFRQSYQVSPNRETAE